ncbi:hypothetical protein [Desertivirga arenae]|uniref:hypothetical protein n=1 Tax=Desertivirga arenae TaxID=2810309 RepID=UPI001A964AF0|nr:hypothetical protein [Pedobacter sp. SYSU D00823]
MKHLALSLALFLSISVVKSQNKIGPIEQKVTDSICACLNKIDMSQIKTKDEATNAFMNCFSRQASLLIPLATERKVEITDKAAMREVGIDVGKNLLNQNCQAFMTLSMVMAKEEIDKGETDKAGTTSGKIKRIETKEFNHIVITDQSGKEKTFIWLRQFDGADKFAGNPGDLVGKKVSISWTEIEAYVPSAKAYFPLKEVVKVSME